MNKLKLILKLCSVVAVVLVLNCVVIAFEKTTDIEGAGQWPNADSLFRKNSHWRGSDDAYSVKLGKDRVLWLFGDTLISSKDKIVPRAADHIKMPRNSIAIQTGLNPSEATIKYYWNDNNDSKDPKSFFRSPYIDDENWLWPGDCTLLPDGKTLVIFFMNIMPTNTGLHFDIAGYQVGIIRNSSDSPDKWNIEWLKHISDYSSLKILIGSGGVLVDGDYLHAYGYSSNKNIGGVALARWPLKTFEHKNSNVSNPQWWTVKGWIKEKKLGSLLPSVIWDKQQTEFTVTKMGSKTYLMVQAYPPGGFIGNGDLVYRVSQSLTGPWSEQKVIYKKLCRDNPFPKDIMVYAGKYHPELTASGYIFTYATNTKSLDTLWNWPNIYYPRFIKLDKCNFTTQIKQSLAVLSNQKETKTLKIISGSL